MVNAMQTAPSKLQTPMLALLAAVVLGAAALAGCVDADREQEDSAAPEARLEVDKTSAFAGETFTFDASGSSDSDGNVTAWRFDFGDGTTFEAETEAEAKRAEHSYDQGGEYTVTVTVFDDGEEQEGALSDTSSVTVAVNERYPIAQQTLYAAPANASATTKFTMEFETHEGVDNFEFNVTLQSLLIAGSSEITVRVLDPSGEAIVNETVSLDAQASQDVDLEGALAEEGVHKVEIEAESGGAQATGELRVYYDEEF